MRHTNTASEVGGKTNGTLPNITGTVNAPVYGSLTTPTGAFYNLGSNWTTLRGDAASHPPTAFKASRSSSVYADDVTYVRPKSMLVRYLVKYI